MKTDKMDEVIDEIYKSVTDFSTTSRIYTPKFSFPVGKIQIDVQDYPSDFYINIRKQGDYIQIEYDGLHEEVMNLLNNQALCHDVRLLMIYMYGTHIELHLERHGFKMENQLYFRNGLPLVGEKKRREILGKVEYAKKEISKSEIKNMWIMTGEDK